MWKDSTASAVHKLDIKLKKTSCDGWLLKFILNEGQHIPITNHARSAALEQVRAEMIIQKSERESLPRLVKWARYDYKLHYYGSHAAEIYSS